MGDDIPHKDAMFGLAFEENTGTKVTGRVYYLTEDLDGCKEYDRPVKTDDRTVPIYMVDRGNCTFTEKVRRAQEKGAGAVIVVNNKCICTDGDNDPLCPDDDNCVPFLPYMADDGTGSSLRIPAFLITYEDGKRIQNYIKEHKDQPVIVDLVLDLHRTDNHVEWEVWMFADNPPEMLPYLKDFALNTRDKTGFTPKYLFYTGEAIGCNYTESCDQLCVSKGVEPHSNDYCALPYFQSVSGKAVVQETERQGCLYKVLPADGKVAWWDYMELYMDACIAEENPFECGAPLLENVLRNTGYTHMKSAINECIEKSCDQDAVDKKDMCILQAEEADRFEIGMFMQNFVVNGKVEHFSLDALRIANIVCEGFRDDDQAPSICRSCISEATTSDELELCFKCRDESRSYWCDATSSCVKNEKSCIQEASPGVKTGNVILYALLVSIPIGVLIFLYFRRTKQKMHEDVRNILAEYMPLEEVDGTGNGTSLQMASSMGNSGSDETRLGIM